MTGGGSSLDRAHDPARRREDGRGPGSWGVILVAPVSGLPEADAAVRPWLAHHRREMEAVALAFGAHAVEASGGTAVALFLPHSEAGKRVAVCRAAACARAMLRKFAEYGRVPVAGTKRVGRPTLRVALACGGVSAAAPWTGDARSDALAGLEAARSGEVVASEVAADWLQGQARLGEAGDGFRRVLSSPRVSRRPVPRGGD